MAEIASIELYLTECYTCRVKKYEPLYRWIVQNQIPMSAFRVCRIPLDRKWVQLAETFKQNAGIGAPFVIVRTDKGAIIYQYDKFLEEGIRMFSQEDAKKIWNNIMLKKVDDTDVKVVAVKKERKVKTKKTSMKKDETISTEVEE